MTAPDGRIVVSAWIPIGAITTMYRIARETVRERPRSPGWPAPFAWQDRDAVAGLLEPHGFTVTTEEHELAFSDASPTAFLEGEQANYPLAVAGRAVLEPRGELRGPAPSACSPSSRAPTRTRMRSASPAATSSRRRAGSTGNTVAR